MVRSIYKSKALVGAVALAILGIGAPAAASSDVVAQPVDHAGTAIPAGVTPLYIITYEEAGLLDYQGSVAGMAATAPERAKGQRKLNVDSIESLTYGKYLESQRMAHLAAIESELGRSVRIQHEYSVTLNGVAAAISAEEADHVAKLPGVKSVVRETFEKQMTFRGPAFIGAGSIWNGSGVPNGVGNKGQGVAIAVLDSGNNAGHPSFANDSVDACGFTAANPKTVAKDCFTSSGGVCTGTNPEANPSFGHGLHTATTAAGNTISNAVTPSPGLPNGVPTMSGVAPCAKLLLYKVCASDFCNSAAILAGIQNAITDQADVLSFSIGGGTDPWNASDNNRQFLNAVNADILVAAAAGNNSPDNPGVVGRVVNRGPWMLTVAASTQDQTIAPTLSVTGPITPPASLVNIPLLPSSTTIWGSVAANPNAKLLTYPANIEGCTASGGFPANYFVGAMAVVRRGTCSFVEKITNAHNAGATLVFVTNNQATMLPMATTGIPTAARAYSIANQATGDALIAFVNAHPSNGDIVFQNGFDGALPQVGTMADFNPTKLLNGQADVLASFSFRGPLERGLGGLTKPDITGPGVGILAGQDKFNGNYGVMSGTSMSTPHVAGAAALVRAAHPTWTVSEVKSALMMTATGPNGSKEDGVTPWDSDEVGSGRVDLTKAALAGLTMDETVARYLAANPDNGGLDLSQLNLPSFRNILCSTSCTWTRTVKNRLASEGTWTISSQTDPSFSMSASPTTFTLAAGATQTITFTATPLQLGDAGGFGYVMLTESSNRSPLLRIPVFVRPTPNAQVSP